MRELKIGEIAKKAGVNIQTIRYYERVGILKPVHRRDSGYRIFDDQAIKTVNFIKHAQKLGFSLREIQGLLCLKASGSQRCESIQRQATRHLGSVQSKIETLERIGAVLERLVQRCQERKRDTECPILDALDKE